MSNQLNNNLSGIDKYSGSFDQDELGVTVIPTETIKLLNNFTLLALFTFLASCSSNWKLNAKHLAKHFNCNKDKIYNAIDGLIELRLLTRTQVRINGKFHRYHYRLHLRQIVQESPSLENPDTEPLPNPEIPCLEKPDTVNPDAYKTNILPSENKEIKKLTNCKSSSSDLIFSETIDQNILEQKLNRDKRTDDEFMAHVVHHVDNNSDKKYKRIVRAQSALRMLKKLKEQNIIFESSGFENKIETKVLTQDEINKRRWEEREAQRRKLFPYDYNEDGTRKDKKRNS